MSVSRSKPKLRIESKVRARALHLLLLCMTVPAAASAQLPQGAPERVSDQIAQLKSGSFTLATVEQIAEEHAVQAIPALKDQFVSSKDTTAKAKIASALVRLGDKDDIYWNYLIEKATDAIQSGTPLPMVYDANGKVVRGQASKEFLDWAKAHDVSPESAGQDAVLGLPGKVAILGETGDPRAIPLLRQALSSPNFIVGAMAAKGLAAIQDKESIPLIVEACSKAPSDGARAIADSLIYFDDDRAQAAADVYLSKEYADALRDARLAGRKPLR